MNTQPASSVCASIYSRLRAFKKSYPPDGREEQIPNSSLGEGGGRTYLTLDTDDQYRIELRGEALGTFDLRLEELIDHNPVSKLTYLDIPVSKTTVGRLTIQRHISSAIQLQLDVDGDGVIDFTIAPNAHPNISVLLQILTAIVRTLGLLPGIQNSLSSKLEAATAALERGNREAAVGVLGALINEIEAQKGKRIPALDGGCPADS